MTEVHLNSTRRWLQNPELRRGIDSLGEPGDEHVAYWHMRWANEREEAYAILDEQGEHVGNCGLRDIDRQRRKAELWIYLGERRGMGVGTAAARALLARAFDELHLNRVFLRTREDNPGAARFYERLGFVLEGRLRQDTWESDRPIDSLSYACMREDRVTLRELRAEVERAAGYYYHTPQQTGIDNRTRRFVIERCLPYVQGPSVLEMGYIDGAWTDHLVAHNYSVDIVEGATRHAQHARKRFRGDDRVRVFHCLFQEFEPEHAYDTVLAGDIIRYLPDPLEFLATARAWVSPGGRMIVTVPNSRSLHRRIGALLGLEPTPGSQNRRDAEVGNRRGYDRYELRQVLVQAGLNVEALHGCFLKPVSSAQMEDWSDDLLRAFRDVGDELEDYAWFLYAVCTPRQ